MFARYVYCLTLSLVLLAYFRIMAEGEVGSEILSLLTLMAGVGGHQPGTPITPRSESLTIFGHSNNTSLPKVASIVA